MKRRLIALTLLGLIAIAAALGYKQRLLNPPPPKGTAITGGKELHVKIPVNLQRQGDPRWRNDYLGPSKSTLGAAGCTVCATAMALSSQGFVIDAKSLNASLGKHDGFTESGLLIWKAIGEVTDGQFSVKIKDRPSHAYLDKQLQQGNPLIAKVFYNNAIWHWVLITGKEGQDYLMHDPLTKTGPHEKMTAYTSGIFAVRHLRTQ